MSISIGRHGHDGQNPHRRQKMQTGGVGRAVTRLTLVSDEDHADDRPDAWNGRHVDDRDVRDDLSNYSASSRRPRRGRTAYCCRLPGRARDACSSATSAKCDLSPRIASCSRATPESPCCRVGPLSTTPWPDWTNVGCRSWRSPPSPLSEISQPYCAQRPVVPLPPAVLLQPQTHAPTLSAGAGGVGHSQRHGRHPTTRGHGASHQFRRPRGDDDDGRRWRLRVPRAPGVIRCAEAPAFRRSAGR